jgi:hypothetical protein
MITKVKFAQINNIAGFLDKPKNTVPKINISNKHQDNTSDTTK